MTEPCAAAITDGARPGAKAPMPTPCGSTTGGATSPGAPYSGAFGLALTGRATSDETLVIPELVGGEPGFQGIPNWKGSPVFIVGVGMVSPIDGATVRVCCITARRMTLAQKHGAGALRGNFTR